MGSSPHDDFRRMHDDYRRPYDYGTASVMPSTFRNNTSGGGEESDQADKQQD
jgi:hypothetical protein